MANIVASRRAALHMTQQEAARRAGISLNTWQRVESGRSEGTRNSTLVKMASVLKINATELTTGDKADDATLLEQQRKLSALKEVRKFNRLYPMPPLPRSGEYPED